MTDERNSGERSLLELSAAIRSATRRTLIDARRDGALAALAEHAGEGAGDVTFGLDLPSEHVLSEWLDARAREGPISLLTEDSGWRHRGPASGGGVRDLDGFDHGGPRVVVDPVDGTRNLMAELRSAWACLAWAPPGPRAPRLEDVELGVVAEIPTANARFHRVLVGARGAGCRFEERDLETDALLAHGPLRTDGEARVDRGYFPFFRYLPHQRPRLAAVEAAFFERLEAHEGAHVRDCYDDQYISNAGQLALLARGTYRFVADLRAELGRRDGGPLVTSKPYDLAGAVVCAREAGCAITDAAGAELDFPLDATTPVGFVGYVNAATRARLEPHLAAALRDAGAASG